MSETVLECKDIFKNYEQGPLKVEVLQGLALSVRPGQHIAIVGMSGSGKSTLLNILGGLDQPNQGSVTIKGEAFSKLSDNERGRVRNANLGFVYQFHHLLGEFTALENVSMPLLIGGQAKKTAAKIASDLLGKVGLAHRLEHKPSELSGGERQRVAIARALANNPACVLMDEPTGNLDGNSARSVQELMRQLSETLSTAFVVVTHDPHFANQMDAVYELKEGRLTQLEAAS